ncbi:MAG: hypothetical protein ABI488_14610 [Polyangiaceae bacterium]
MKTSCNRHVMWRFAFSGRTWWFLCLLTACGGHAATDSAGDPATVGGAGGYTAASAGSPSVATPDAGSAGVAASEAGSTGGSLQSDATFAVDARRTCAGLPNCPGGAPILNDCVAHLESELITSPPECWALELAALACNANHVPPPAENLSCDAAQAYMAEACPQTKALGDCRVASGFFKRCGGDGRILDDGSCRIDWGCNGDGITLTCEASAGGGSTCTCYASTQTVTSIPAVGSRACSLASTSCGPL